MITLDFPRADMGSMEPLPERDRGVKHMVAFDSKGESPQPETASPPPALESYNLERHQNQWAEQKRLGARAVTLPGYFSRSLCSDSCICACHSVKNWGRWALHPPFLGSLMISYRGVTQKRIPCSNSRCKSLESQGKLVRMDVHPPTWLVRATMSVFLSFGLPNPELVIRVNRVTEHTDVHSSMNQFLWAIQREEVAGVKHFLQSREVRADDIWGPPAVGLTPLRLALDRKSGEVAQLL